MRIPGFIMTVLCMVLGCDLYIFFRLRKRWRNAAVVHAVVSLLLYILLAAGLIVLSRGQTDGNVRFMMWCGFTFLSFSAAKITAVVFDLISMLPRIWHATQWRFLSATGMVLSILIFAGMWWGALVNRFRIDINEVEVAIPDLPEGFDGFRIAQFSDLHTGTFGTDTTFTSRLVDEINALDADLIAFTGDIVNSRSEEIIPHLRPLTPEGCRRSDIHPRQPRLWRLLPLGF